MTNHGMEPTPPPPDMNSTDPNFTEGEKTTTKTKKHDDKITFDARNNHLVWMLLMKGPMQLRQTWSLLWECPGNICWKKKHAGLWDPTCFSARATEWISSASWSCAGYNGWGGSASPIVFHCPKEKLRWASFPGGASPCTSEPFHTCSNNSARHHSYLQLLPVFHRESFTAKQDSWMTDLISKLICHRHTLEVAIRG